MKTISIYGKPSYPYDFIKTTISQVIDEAELKIEIHEIQEMDTFIKDHILKIPAVKYNGEIRSFENTNLTDFTKSIKQWILKTENYGSLKKIIVPIDFSSSSENALAYAMKLANEQYGMVKVIHSYVPAPVVSENSVYLNQELENIEKRKFDQFINFINDEWVGDVFGSKVLVESEFVLGFAGDTILEDADQLRDGFIVMGSKGDSGVQKRFFGSVSTVVARDAQCPVVIVPENVTYNGFRNVMYCCDDLELDGQMVNPLIDFIQGHGSKIHLVHFGKEDNYKNESLQKIWKEFYSEDNVEYTLLESMAKKESVNDFCKIKNIDLIVVVRPKRGTIANLLHKSFTKELTIFSTTPLLILNKN